MDKRLHNHEHCELYHNSVSSASHADKGDKMLVYLRLFNPWQRGTAGSRHRRNAPRGYGRVILKAFWRRLLTYTPMSPTRWWRDETAVRSTRRACAPQLRMACWA